MLDFEFSGPGFVAVPLIEAVEAKIETREDDASPVDGVLQIHKSHVLFVV